MKSITEATKPQTEETWHEVEREENISYDKLLIKYSFTSPFLTLDYKDSLRRSKNQKEGYTQGCKWSPDGTCFLVAGHDKRIRIFDIPQNVSNGEFNDEAWIMGGWKDDAVPSAVIRESEYIYDYSWYPLMNRQDRESQCFAVTCRELPIHLWDSTSGQFICNYIHYNHLDQLVPAHSLAFSSDGRKLIGGYAREIREFDTDRPGKVSREILSQDQSGIISTLAFHPIMNTVFAAGSYGSSVGLYSQNTKQAFAFFQCHKRGVTHVQFSRDGTKMFSGTRKDDDIFCWDMRNPGEVFGIFQRRLTTNQKMFFDVTPDDHNLISGTTDGDVLVWDLLSEETSPKSECGEILPTTSFKAHYDCVNGISVHPYKTLLLTSSGQRSVHQLEHSDSSESEGESQETKLVNENSVKLWHVG